MSLVKELLSLVSPFSETEGKTAVIAEEKPPSKEEPLLFVAGTDRVVARKGGICWVVPEERKGSKKAEGKLIVRG